VGVPAVVALGGNKGVTVIKEKKQDKKDSVFGELSTVSRSVLIRLYPLDHRYAVRGIFSMISL
jgi:hypothetical protein